MARRWQGVAERAVVQQMSPLKELEGALNMEAGEVPLEDTALHRR